MVGQHANIFKHPAAAKEVSRDAAVVALIFEMDNKEEQQTALRTFLGRHVFALRLTAFGESFVEHCGASRLATGDDA